MKTFKIQENNTVRDATPEETAEILADLAAHEKTTYASKRSNEYPPIVDYIDGVVKGDQAQIDAYIAACLAVKDKYPKP